MMSDFTTAFLEGKKRIGGEQVTNLGNPVSIGNPVGTIGEYDPRTSPVYDTAMSADKISGFGLKPGQKRGHFGTTVFQPKRNDPEVEAVLGPDVYKQKISSDSPEVLRLKQLDLENIIKQQQAQIDTLTKLMSGKLPDVPETPIQESEIVPVEILVGAWRDVAKRNGVKTFGRKKDEVIAELKDKGLM
jgi:hypothetical protein